MHDGSDVFTVSPHSAIYELFDFGDTLMTCHRHEFGFRWCACAECMTQTVWLWGGVLTTPGGTGR